MHSKFGILSEREDRAEWHASDQLRTFYKLYNMDRGACQATNHGVTRVGLDLATKPHETAVPLLGTYPEKNLV